MKRIGDASFFRIVDRLLAAAPARGPSAQWDIGGTHWQRHRHSYSDETYGFTVEVTAGSATHKPPWTLLIVKEYWRKTDGGDAIRSHQWAHIAAGRRTDVMAWLKRQERELDR